MGYVYLILEVDKHGEETYKIGISKSDQAIRQRLKNLQTGNPNKIEILKRYESVNYLRIEQWLHRQYSTKTEADNEWRSLSNEEIINFLEDCKKADETISFMKANNPFFK